MLLLFGIVTLLCVGDFLVWMAFILSNIHSRICFVGGLWRPSTCRTLPAYTFTLMSIHICFYLSCQIRGGMKTVPDSALCKFHTDGRWNNGAILPPRRGSVRGVFWLIWWHVRTHFNRLQEPKELNCYHLRKSPSKCGMVLCLACVNFIPYSCYASIRETTRPCWKNTKGAGERLINSTHMSVESVRHELKLSIWRNEGDGTVILEARQTDTLMKLDILQLYWFTLPSCKMKETKQIILKGKIKIQEELTCFASTCVNQD